MSSVWMPNKGGQTLLLGAPFADILIDGDRGGGKSDVLLVDFMKEVNKGYGSNWRGVIIRQSYKAVEELITKAHEMVPKFFPDAKFRQGDRYIFRTGEVLVFDHASRLADYHKFHGKNYTFIGVDELTTYGDPELISKIKSTLRTATVGVPLKFRATTNPFGPGHNWVKRRYIDPAPMLTPIVESITNPITKEVVDIARLRIQCSVKNNLHLLRADPNYLARMSDGLTPAQFEAWINGNWDITAGGIFDDLWDPAIHIVPRFEIPSSWYVDRCFDWGGSSPSAIIWIAESDGTPATVNGVSRIFPKGSLVAFHEWYGWNGQENKGNRMTCREIAQSVKDVESGAIKYHHVHAGPADDNIFTATNGKMMIDDFTAMGVYWNRATKGPDSRINGWQLLRQMIFNAIPKLDFSHLETPHLYFTDNCRHLIRTFPGLPADEKKLDDVDTDAEDHLADALRYRVLDKRAGIHIERMGF